MTRHLELFVLGLLVLACTDAHDRGVHISRRLLARAFSYEAEAVGWKARP